MLTQRLRRAAGTLALLAMIAAGGVARAETGTPQPAPADYSRAQFVKINLGEQSQEMGIRLLQDQPDGLTTHLPDVNGRQSLPNPAGTERFFYFDIHDSYIAGGKNTIIMDVQYLDVGLTPVFLEYDSYDPRRPDSKADDVVRKRVVLTHRTNSEGLKLARIELDDARFGNSQPGGADFRVASSDDLIITNVSVLRVAHQPALPPPTVILDGRVITFDSDEVQPFINPESGRILVPFRAMFNAMGIADEDIAWDGETRTITAKKGQTIVNLRIESKVAIVNMIPQEMDQEPIIVGGRTVVPVRFVGTFFGLDIGWDGQRRIVTLTTQPSPTEPAQPGEPGEPGEPMNPEPPTAPQPPTGGN